MPRRGMARFFSPRPILDLSLRQRLVDSHKKSGSSKAWFGLTEVDPRQRAPDESGAGAADGTRLGQRRGEAGGIFPLPLQRSHGHGGNDPASSGSSPYFSKRGELRRARVMAECQVLLLCWTPPNSQKISYGEGHEGRSTVSL